MSLPFDSETVDHGEIITETKETTQDLIPVKSIPSKTSIENQLTYHSLQKITYLRHYINTTKLFFTSLNQNYFFLVLFSMSTASAYLSMISFQTMFLTVFYRMDYSTAKNIEFCQPIFFIVVIT